MKSSLFLAAVLVCGLVRAQLGGQPGGQPGAQPGRQPGGQPGAQPGRQPGGLPGSLPERVLKLEANIDILTKSRVAFSAALVETDDWTTKGPLEADQTLEFKRVITNIGNGYDPATGVFTAPVKGLYYIQVTGVAGPNGELHAGVKKDGVNMFAIYQKAGTQAGASNAMVMALERGNRVFVQLWAGKTIADQGRLSTFTGFLVFPM